MPQTDSAVLGGLPLTSTDFREFRVHGPRIKIDDLSALTGRCVARVSAFVRTGDDRLGRAPFWPVADATLIPVFAVPSGATPPDLPPRGPTPPSEASVALRPTGRISTRTRRRTAAAAGAAQPAVDYGFGPGGVPRTPSSRVDPPPRVPRPRLPLAAAPSASRAPTPVPTVPIPSDRDQAVSRFRALDPFGISLRPYGRFRRSRRCCRPTIRRFRCALFARRLGERASCRAHVLRRHTIHCSRPAVGLAHRSLSAFPLTPAPPPSRRSRSSLAKADSILPTRTLSSSSVVLTRPTYSLTNGVVDDRPCFFWGSWVRISPSTIIKEPSSEKRAASIVACMCRSYRKRMTFSDTILGQPLYTPRAPPYT